MNQVRKSMNWSVCSQKSPKKCFSKRPLVMELLKVLMVLSFLGGCSSSLQANFCNGRPLEYPAALIGTFSSASMDSGSTLAGYQEPSSTLLQITEASEKIGRSGLQGKSETKLAVSHQGDDPILQISPKAFFAALDAKICRVNDTYFVSMKLQDVDALINPTLFEYSASY